MFLLLSTPEGGARRRERVSARAPSTPVGVEVGACKLKAAGVCCFFRRGKGEGDGGKQRERGGGRKDDKKKGRERAPRTGAGVWEQRRVSSPPLGAETK